MTVLHLENVSVKRRGKFVIQDCSLNLSSGEVCLLMGPNGAGKTTTLLACAGLLSIATGRLRILGQDLSRHAYQVMKDVAFISDDPFLYDHLTPHEFYLLSARLRKRSVDSVALRKWSDQFGLPLDGLLLKEFSLGMRRKVGLISQLIFGPRLVLMDEPFNALDHPSGAQLREAINLLVNNGTAFLITTHRPDEVAGLPHSMCLISDGAMIHSLPGPV